MKRAALLAALFCLTAPAASADPKEAHKLGVAALESGRWEDAERFFRAAIAERPQEKYNRLLRTAYLPHYYLGVALAEQGKCRAALASFSESRKQGQIQKSKQTDDLDDRSQRCQSHLRQVAAAVAEVEQLLGRVTGASSSLASLARKPDLAALWDRGDPSFGSRQKDADRKLQESRRRFDQGREKGDLDVLDDSKSLAREALEAYESTLATAQRRLGELNAAAASALDLLQEAERNAHRALRSVSDLAPYPPRLGSRVSTVEKLLEEITDNKSEAGASVLQGVTDELEAAVGALYRAARRPPAQLSRAAQAFFSGAFEEAVELLEEERLAEDSRARPHVCLLRAASRHALWVAGGESDDALLELAARDVAACAGSDPPLAPSARFFSPRFVEFSGRTLESLAAEGEKPAQEGAEVEAGAAESR